MTGSDIQQQVVSFFRTQANRFHLEAGSLNAERVLNSGGFGSHSYRVGDGTRSVHAKLSTDQAEMRRWQAVHDGLEANYRAPKVLGCIDLPGTAYGGLVFEHIEGQTWGPTTRPELFHDLKDLLTRPHADAPLADALGERPKSYRQCWEIRYREQFEEDLKTLRMSRPASVPEVRLKWMGQQTHEVLALPEEEPAFDGNTRSTCHWDLWQNNVLVESCGRWWVIDWDSLAVGDEAEDIATLAWPLVHYQTEDWRELPGGDGGWAFARRMDLHIRGIAQDYLIDVLADWSECDVPEWQDEVQRRKEADHERFFDWYRSRWG